MADNKMLQIAILSLLVILAFAQDRCKSKGIFTYGKCPEVDQDFSTDLFVKCASLLQFGCIMQPSTTVSGKFVCTLDPTKVEADKICAGDKIVFDGIDIRKNNILSYFLDLNAAPIDTDFYLLSDATGSMRGAIADVQKKFKLIIEQFQSDNTKVAFGVGYYRDTAGANNGFTNLQPISTNLRLSTSAVNVLRASGGGDAPEANLVALHQVATSSAIKWRKNSRRILVYFGDNPGHEPSCVGGKSLTRVNVGDALKKARITVVGVTFGVKKLDGKTKPFKCSGSGAGAGQATHITSVTGGRFETASSDSAVVETIRNALKNLPRKYDADESDCISTITSKFNPKNPWLLLPGDSTTVKHTMELKDRVCDTGGSFECKFKFSDFGGELPGTSIAFVNVKGC
eukprot:IDg1792t1